MQTCGVILSGGRSSRMGTNKSLLDIDGKTAIEQIANELKKCSHETAVITNEPAIYEFLGLNLYQDRYQDKGPLAGIESALHHVDADVYFFAACDMPFIHQGVYRHLWQAMNGADAVIPIHNDRMHPLSGIYTKNVLPHIQMLLEHDERKIRALFEHIDVHYVTDYDGIAKQMVDKHFFNMNYPAQFEEAKRFQ
ncbi:molybdenum cofactor guanylyltransferase [Lentibacillus salinarum]|uniref:Probable molybdenum cofactor guanylyltransferase n=1 Tax=Lentibacillus salinarum TaxID=446820 RepID=A0ABW3ZR61_9BACI